MPSPYGLDIFESCLSCTMRAEHNLCDLPATALKAFESIKFVAAYPAGAVLFLEGQQPHGIFVLCQGRVKLSNCAVDGKTLILKIADPGEVMGLSASITAKPYELTAETIEPCQITFVKSSDFLRFLKENPEVCFRVAEQLAEKYYAVCRNLRSLMLSHSAAERLAKLLLELIAKTGENTKTETRIKLYLTHEEIAEMIGTSRETVTRLFGEMKVQRIAQLNGSTLVIRNKAALRAFTTAAKLAHGITNSNAHR